MDRETLTIEEYIEHTCKKLHYLEGFADAIENKPLQRFVMSVRVDLNRLERGLVPMMDIEVAIEKSMRGDGS